MSAIRDKRIYVVDDDEIMLVAVKSLFESLGAKVEINLSSVKALEEIKEDRPDLVILDLMMPEMDGMDMCRLMRQESGLNATKIVFFSGKTYEHDQQRAMSYGADGYLIKPFLDDSFIKAIEEILDEKIEVTYWGVRGTLPVPGEKTLKYGGNTACTTIQFPKGAYFILDAGSGIKQLSDHLMKEAKHGFHGKLLISHPHWDHINALPFFAPLYVPGNEFEIFGASHGHVTMRELISAQMDGVYFPIRIKEFAARTYFRDLKEEEFMVADVKVKTLLLSHPGTCLGYRMEYKDRSVCYITDNELFPEGAPGFNQNYWNKLVEFIRGTNILITDTTYTDEEYEKKVGWGHSSISQVVKLAHEAETKELHLFHHDPDQNDDDIDRKLEMAQSLLKEMKSQTVCVAPAELQAFNIV